MPLDITQAARITFRLRQTTDNEQFQFGVSTGARGNASHADLLDAVATWWDDEGSSCVAQTTCDEITYSEWSDEGFTGWHQRASLLTAITSGTGAVLPPQCAVVVSLLNLGSSDVSIKRRRGRMYLGLVPISQLATDGRLTSGARTVYTDAFQLLDDAMESVAGFDPEFDGPGIASAAAGELYVADRFGVGLAVDTQRRRRQKVTEGITYIQFT
jgi:hypothetical protein